MNKLFVTAALLVAALLLPSAVGAKNYKLWYKEPARVWTDALPLGNGRLGAMVYGIPQMEMLQLNEETIWTGQPNNNYNTDAKNWIGKINQMIFEGRYAEAEKTVNAHVMSQTNSGMAYQPFGYCTIAQAGTDDYTSLRRELSLDSAISTTTFSSHGVDYKREVIVPLGGSAVMMKLTASKPGAITFTANLTTPHVDPIIKSENGEVSLHAVASNLEGLKGKVKLMGRMTATAKGGKVSCEDGLISVRGADEAVIYISIATNFTNYKSLADDEVAKSESQLRSAVSEGFDSAKAKHLQAYKAQFDRVSLDLGADLYPQLPTDERLIAFQNHDDGHLVATYFQFGRYLLISSSQPGTQPATLQGIWNDKMFPAWDSKYTTNINLEMNYWPSETTNLQELNQPLFGLINDVSHTGHETAMKMYGKKDGWVTHHNTDIWRVTGAIDHAPSGMWMTCGAWLSAHLWQHYLFTGDKQFLRQAYPIMKGAAQFLDAMLVEEPTNHWLVIAPSVSPENRHPAGNDKNAMSAGTTMDNTLLRELFGNLVAAQKILGIDTDSSAYYTQRAALLPPMQIGNWGQLQEWMQDWDDPDDTHRHVSHLYGVFPGQTISPRLSPVLADAARTSLIHRGDPSTGWSMGWKVCLWARLLDGNHAYKLIHNQLTLTDDRFLAYGTNKKSGGTYRNLFDAHPPFQIDGNFGCAAGIAEMLVQSHDGAVSLLPAIPDVWKDGEVKGLLTRGGFEITDLKWTNGRITRLKIKSRLGGNLRLRSPQKIAKLKKAKGQNSNPLMQLQQQPATLNHSKVKAGTFQLKPTWLYDIATRPGQELTLINL